MAKLEPAALRWGETVDERCRALAVQTHFGLAHPRQTHLWGIFVFDYQLNRVGSAVLHLDVNFSLCPNRKASPKFALDVQVLRQMSAICIYDGQKQQTEIICKHGPAEPGMIP